MRAIKPGWRAAFSNQEEIDEARRQWRLALREAGLSDWGLVKQGLSKLRQTPGPFLPSTGDFIALCKQVKLDQYQLPTEHEAYYTLIEFLGPVDPHRDFSKLSPALYAAYKYMDWSTNRGEPAHIQKKAFHSAWQRVQADLLAGRALPEFIPPERRIGPSGTIHNPERSQAVGSSTLDSLKSMFEEGE